MAQNEETKKVEAAAEEDGTMTLTGHLKELKNRIIVCLVVALVGFLVMFSQASTIVDNLTAMGAESNYTFVYLAPPELFMQFFKIGGVGAIVVALPVILYEIYAFSSPGLTRGEKFTFLFAMIGGLVFFILGIIFAYKISLPFMLNFFVTVNTTAAVTASISIAEYLSFILTIFLIFGCVFELPIVTVILTQLGIINPQIMIKVRPFAIVIMFVLGALITPPDVVSQCLVAVPMIILYEFSILLCRIFSKRKKENEENEDNNDDEDDE